MNLSLNLVIQLLMLRFTSPTVVRSTGTDTENDDKVDEEPDSLMKLKKDRLFIGQMGYFKKVRLSHIFVDKTGFIEEFLNWAKRKPDIIIYISGPPRFGKSSLVDMLHLFLDAPEQFNNTITIQKDPHARTLFEKTYIKLKDGGKYFEENFQKFKVISIDFRMLALVEDFASFKVNVCVMICETMRAFRYLRHFGSKFVWCHYESRAECEAHCQATFPSSLLSIKYLAQELWTFFRKPIIIFGDELDAILYSLFQKKVLLDADVIMKHFGILLSALSKGNDYIKACLFFGSVTLGGVISPLANNMKHFNFNDDTPFAKYIGFTEAEVKKLLEDAGIECDEKVLYHWYNGHEVIGKQKLNLHNPVSITNFVINRRFDYYWSKHVADLSNEFSDFFAHPEIGSSINLIMHRQSPEVQLSEGLASFNKVQELKDIVRSKNKNLVLHKNRVDLFLQFLMESGYLTRINNPEDNSRVTLKVTNKETRHSMDRYMEDARYYEKVYEIQPQLQADYVDALYKLSDNETSFMNLAKSIHNIIKKKCSSVRDENVHVLGALYNFLIFTNDISIPFPEIEAELNITTTKGLSRFLDMILIRNDGTAIIMEAERSHPYAITGLGQLLRDEHYDAIHQYFKKYSIKQTIFMRMSIREKCACQIRWIINSHDIKDAKHNNVVYPD